MKKITLILSLLLLTISVSQAQKAFEGTIEFELKMMGDGADQFAAFMPNKQVMQFGDGNMTMVMEGGMAAAVMGKILIQEKGEKVFMIKDADKSAIELIDEAGEEEEVEGPDPVVTDLDETIKILGYTCKKYKVVVESPEGPVTQYIWATDEFKIESSGNAKGIGGGSSLSIKGVNGLPLKMMSSMNQMGMDLTTIMTATLVDTEKLDKDTFKVPKGYTVEKKTASELFGGMMGQ